MIKLQKKLEKYNAFLIELIIKRTKITKELFFEKENTTFESERAIEMGVASKIVNMLLTIQEIEKFVDSFLENKKLPFEVSEDLHKKLIKKLEAYQNFIITKSETQEMCVFDIMESRGALILKDINDVRI